MRASDLDVADSIIERHPRRLAIQWMRGSTSTPAAAGTEEEPEDETQQRQQQHQDDPERLLAVGGGALRDVDDRPDVADQDQQAQEAVVAGVEHGSIPQASGGWRDRRILRHLPAAANLENADLPGHSPFRNPLLSNHSMN